MNDTIQSSGIPVALTQQQSSTPLNNEPAQSLVADFQQLFGDQNTDLISLLESALNGNNSDMTEFTEALRGMLGQLLSDIGDLGDISNLGDIGSLGDISKLGDISNLGNIGTSMLQEQMMASILAPMLLEIVNGPSFSLDTGNEIKVFDNEYENDPDDPFAEEALPTTKFDEPTFSFDSAFKLD